MIVYIHGFNSSAQSYEARLPRADRPAGGRCRERAPRGATMLARLPLLAVLALGCTSRAPADIDEAGDESAAGSTTATSPGSTTTAPTTGDTGAATSTSSTSTGLTGAATTVDGAGTDATTGPAACEPLKCGGLIYECGDCEDNDADGRVDLLDPECIGPCDGREDMFSAGPDGDSKDPCKQDCFFDGDTGNDACQWFLSCDPKGPGGLECPYDPNQVCEPQLPECAGMCRAPNGCDCFGCCSVVVDGVSRDVYLGDEDCTLAALAGCRQCTKNPECDDECEPDACEVCFAGALPPGCEEPGCDGTTPCQLDAAGGSQCPEGTFCQTGCCEPIEAR